MPPTYFIADSPLAYAKQRFIDRRRPVPAAPEAAQVQSVSGCNANCVFCPNKKTELDIPMGKRMDWGLYESIVDQIIELGVKRFSPYLMNESMLDTELPKRIRYFTDRKKKWQYSKINSHGGLLTERMAKGLLDSGLDRLNFSVQGLDPETYEKIMGIPLAKTLRNVERFLKMRDEAGVKMRVRIVMLDTTDIHDEIPAIKKYWKERGVKININQLENRGNHKGIVSDAIAVRELQAFDWCNRLFEQIYILYDGRLVQCCADWEQTSHLGDLTRVSLREAWHGALYADMRRRFLSGNVQGTICDGCTKDAAGDDGDE